jgi:prephenate dehydrogenase
MSIKGIKKIAIIGVGFMGGSLALALKKKFGRLRVWGYARSNRSYNKLKRLRILDGVERDLKKLLVDADIVVLSLPVGLIIDYLKKISPLLQEGTIVFDLGSSKKKIEGAARKYLPKGLGFVGCHPLCGSEKSGAEFSDGGLFEGSLCIITSPLSKRATRTVAYLWRHIGSRVVYVNPDYHDRVLSFVSHLPHLISFSLTSMAPDSYVPFFSGSFRDLTRISGSPSPVWADIFMSNKTNILRDLRRFIRALTRYERLMKSGDKDKLKDLIDRVNTKQRHIVNV